MCAVSVIQSYLCHTWYRLLISRSKLQLYYPVWHINLVNNYDENQFLIVFSGKLVGMGMDLDMKYGNGTGNEVN